MKMIKTPHALAILTGALLSVAVPASASSFLITVDTSPLSGTQTLAFALTNSNSASNTVRLSDFDLDGGSPVAGTDDCTFGGTFNGLGCSGDLTTSVGLEDLDAVAFFMQQFTPGVSVSFVLTTTNDAIDSVPDQFAMLLCDATVATCYSDDAALGAMLLLDLVGGSLSPASFVALGAAAQGLAAPGINPARTVPEPITALLLGSGGAGLLARHRHRRSMRPRRPNGYGVPIGSAVCAGRPGVASSTCPLGTRGTHACPSAAARSGSRCSSSAAGSPSDPSGATALSSGESS